MAIIEHGNYSLDRINNLNVSNGDTIRHTNLFQAQPNIPICQGITNLTFEKCNLGNCSVPADAIVIDCNTAQINRCAHLHPDWGLPSEPENCPHVVDTDEIWIDGELVDIIYHYEDTAVE